MMPFSPEIGANVYGSTLFDHTHKGPNQVLGARRGAKRTGDAAHAWPRMARLGGEEAAGGVWAAGGLRPQLHVGGSCGDVGRLVWGSRGPPLLRSGIRGARFRSAWGARSPNGLFCRPCPQAGNKGLMSYRTDIGVPGYTG
jgi:hypothetical protein